jgi:hypothetical protein
MIPTTLLAVDGSARTFSCVEVIPSTGAAVGVAGGGRGVSVTGGKIVEETAAVMLSAVAVGTDIFSGLIPHPAPNRKKGTRRRIALEVTVGLFCRY